ncbi:MAG: small subunit ribosomal protein S18 [Candidatus Midichloriaceae bacterium]|jgi:small subunit ribosomal protein S18
MEKAKAKEVIIPNTLLFNRKSYNEKPKRCALHNVGFELINYENVELLKKYISEKGKILASRITYVSSKKQRKLANAIKIARHLALLP